MKAILLLAFLVLFAVKCYSQKTDSLRIITYNIHHANPPSKPGLIDLDTIVSILKKFPADVISLQEVDVNTRRSGNVDEAKKIADGLGMQVFFAKAIDYDGGEYGIALLSRFPLQEINVIPLPMDSAVKGEKRVLLYATIKLGSGQKVVVACTHLDHQKNPASRELQVKLIKAHANKIKIPFILAGDFNAETGSPAMALFDETFQRTCEPCPPTFPAEGPNKTIDFIGFKRSKKMRVVLHQILSETYASDHLPLKAVIQFQ